MTLTEQHIENLYAFTRKHFVEYYDLQTELVDHLANDIESIIEEHPQLSFEQARDKAFKKFGVFGFMEVVEERAKAMNKKYMKLLWHYAKDWFRLPQIILTIAIFVSWYALFLTKFGGYVLIFSYSLLCFWLIFKTIKINFKIKQKRKTTKKRWLLEDIIFKNGSLLCIIYITQLFNVFKYLEGYEVQQPLVYAGIFTALIIYIYISTVVLPNNATTHLKETYPEYSL